MLMDALAQFLVAKKWRQALVLKGPRPEDAARKFVIAWMKSQAPESYPAFSNRVRGVA